MGSVCAASYEESDQPNIPINNANNNGG